MPSKRGGRLTHQQKIIILDFAEQNPDILRTRVDNTFTATKKTALWEELTTLLNASGNGAVKSPTIWRKTWTDWKANIRSRWLILKGHKSAAVGSNSNGVALNDVDQRLLNLVGWMPVNGGKHTEQTPSIEQSKSPEPLITQVIKTEHIPPQDFTLNTINDLHFEVADDANLILNDIDIKQDNRDQNSSDESLPTVNTEAQTDSNVLEPSNILTTIDAETQCDNDINIQNTHITRSKSRKKLRSPAIVEAANSFASIQRDQVLATQDLCTAIHEQCKTFNRVTENLIRAVNEQSEAIRALSQSLKCINYK